jgi:UDP-N-acetylmuramate--alanine ligase
VIVLPIYAASEEPLPGITAELLTSKIISPAAQYAPDFAAAIEMVADKARDGDMIMTLGAGSVSQLGPQILAALQTRK